MQRFLSTITLVLFFIWILPLGVFIKPFQEKLACGGKRAICLCSSKMKTSQKPAAVSFQPAASMVKEEAPGASAHQFLPDTISSASIRFSVYFSSEIEDLYSFKICKTIEHIPKA